MSDDEIRASQAAHHERGYALGTRRGWAEGFVWASFAFIAGQLIIVYVIGK